MQFIRAGLTSVCALAFISGACAAPAPSSAIEAAVHDGRRAAASVARDDARHPAAELGFFGVKPTSSVVEVEPGGGYWTGILAPLLHARGTYYVALPSDAEFAKNNAAFRAKLATEPDRFGKIRWTAVGPNDAVAPAGSVDFVLTFRNLHNWMNSGYAGAVLGHFFTALKPGGLLGMEEHRGSASVPQDPKAASGYVRQDYAIDLARKAGFVLVKSSELLANPRDTKDYPGGVWTLPPTFQLGAKDHAKYAAIGEADNFLLLFRKPGK